MAAYEVLLLTKEDVYIANNTPINHWGGVSSVLLTVRNAALMPAYMFMRLFIEDFGHTASWLLIIGVAAVTTLAFYFLSFQQRRAIQLSRSA